MASID